MAGPPHKPSDGFPQKYGKYELLGRLGDGGMAEVFLARQSGVAGFRKTVVVKRILPHLARKKRFVEMFVAEASLAAEVRHRNVVQVYELGRVDDELFMVMEYVEGTDLRVLLGQAAKRRLRIPPWFSIHVVCEVLEALSFAWNLEDERGRPRHIVHRDVTPSNIFISVHGEVKLGDFGVARDHTRESQTRAGQLKGKLAYMAPEQLYSKPPDHRVDVFACGVVLWEALAQRRLFGGRPEIEVMQAIASGSRRPPSEFVTDLPESLDRIVLSALTADREARTPSAERMQEDLLETLSRLRPRVRPSDVQSVVAALTGKREGELEPLTRPSTQTRSGASFVATSSEGEHSPSGTPDLIADLTLNPKARAARQSGAHRRADPPRSASSPGVPSAPPSFGAAPGTPAVVVGRPLPGRAASVPGSPPPRPSSTGRGSMASEPPPEGNAPASSTPSSNWGAPEDQISALEGLMSPSGTGTLDPVGESEEEEPVRGAVDIDALVHDAVADVVAAQPESNLIPKDHYLAGLEHRRILDNSRTLKSERWAFILDQELYDGPHPFWIRDHEGTELGPCSLEQALQVAKVEVQAGLGNQAFIACMRGDWLPVLGFLEMAGMESIADDAAPSVEAPAWVGSTAEHGIGSVLVTLTRSSANGRLIVESDSGTSAVQHRVIEVVGGCPTHVAASGESHQIPQLLVAKRLIHARSLAPLLHGVLARRAPLGEVLQDIAGIQLARYHSTLMKERLGALFGEGFNTFTFDAQYTPRKQAPFAKSLLAPMAELVFRFTPRERVERRVNPVLSQPLSPAQDYPRMVEKLALKPDQARVADKLGRGRRLSKLLDGASPTEVRLVKGIAYILLETELLRPD